METVILMHSQDSPRLLCSIACTCRYTITLYKCCYIIQLQVMSVTLGILGILHKGPTALTRQVHEWIVAKNTKNIPLDLFSLLINKTILQVK